MRVVFRQCSATATDVCLRHDFLKHHRFAFDAQPSCDLTWQPAFRVNLASVPLVCPFRRAEFAPAPAPDSRPAKFFSWRAERLACPKTPPTTERPTASLRPACHSISGSEVSSSLGSDLGVALHQHQTAYDSGNAPGSSRREGGMQGRSWVSTFKMCS
jgi:hypothetical protein